METERLKITKTQIQVKTVRIHKSQTLNRDDKNNMAE